MNITRIVTAAILITAATAAHAESNNLAAVEIPAGTGIYHTMTVPPTAAQAQTSPAQWPTATLFHERATTAPASGIVAKGGSVEVARASEPEARRTPR